MVKKTGKKYGKKDWLDAGFEPQRYPLGIQSAGLEPQICEFKASKQESYHYASPFY